MVQEKVEVPKEIFDDLSRSERVLRERVKDAEAELVRTKVDLEEKNSRLNEFDRVRSDFLAYVAHELRGPLATIMGGLKLVSDGVYGPINEKQHRAIEIADNNVRRLVRIVNNLLDISRIDAGKFKVHREHIDLAILVQQVVALESTVAEAKGISIEARVPDRPVELNADSDAIIQVLTNLAGNAIKFTDVGGITITLVDRKDEVEFSVDDTGIGISSDDLSTIFDRYKQGRKKDMSRGKGTGLGLSIAKGIVEAHGGTIEVASESGKGTTFTITLPKE